jgi:hypothetical protein
MKRMTVLLAIAAFMLFGPAVAPASAQAVRDSSCIDHGLTWDCHFHIKDYTVGTPVTFNVNYTCPGKCGPVLSFGLQEKGFTPEGVSGHLVGGSRMPSGLQLTFVFDNLGPTGNHAMGTGNFLMNVMVEDGTGAMVMVACPVDVRLKSTKD